MKTTAAVLSIGTVTISSGKTIHSWSIYDNAESTVYLTTYGHLLYASPDTFKVGDEVTLEGNDNHRKLGTYEILDLSLCVKEQVIAMLLKHGYDYRPKRPFQKSSLTKKLSISYSIKGTWSDEPIKVVKNIKTILDDETKKFTSMETELIEFMNHHATWGELYSDIDCNDIAKMIKWNVKTVKGVVGSLVKKNVLGTYDTGTGYEVVVFVEQESMTFYHKPIDEFEPTSKAVTPEVSKTVVTETKVAKQTRKVGDIHKNGLWVWTEYKQGKFDWRIAKPHQRLADKKIFIDSASPETESVGTIIFCAAKKNADGIIEITPIKAEPELQTEFTVEEFAAVCKKGIKTASKKFLSEDGFYCYPNDTYYGKKDIEELAKILGNNNTEGIYHYFNKESKPFDMEIVETGEDKEEVKSNNIYDKMAAATTTHYKGSFKVKYQNRVITISRTFSRDTTLSMRDINSFM